MDIGICGFGYSGSGAVIDLLKEYKDVSVASDDEFYISYYPDGLIDLFYHTCDYHARFFNSDVAIKRFLIMAGKFGKNFGWDNKKCNEFFLISHEFVNSIIECSWNGYWTYDISNMSEIDKTWYLRIARRLNRLFNQDIIKSKKKMYLSFNPSNYEASAKAYIKKIKMMMGYDLQKKCVFNQPFAANNPEKSFLFFDEPRAILVTRDPRDIYIMVKHFVKDDASWIPYKDIDNFIKFYKTQYNNVNAKKNVLVISFEDLIYKYEMTKKNIENFLDIKEHYKEQEYFKPSLSARNTRLFEKYPQYEEDIIKIEKALPEFIYKYDNIKIISNQGKCFWD